MNFQNLKSQTLKPIALDLNGKSVLCFDSVQSNHILRELKLKLILDKQVQEYKEKTIKYESINALYESVINDYKEKEKLLYLQNTNYLKEINKKNKQNVLFKTLTFILAGYILYEKIN